MVWNPVERLLWGITICVLFINVLFYLRQRKQKDDPFVKSIFLGTVFIFLGLAVNRVFFYLSEFYVPGGINESYVFMGDYAQVDAYYELILRISWIAYAAGFFFYMFCMENVVVKTKYLFPILQALMIVVIIVADFETAREFNTYAFGYSALVSFIFSYRIITLTSVEYKGLASIHLLGAIFGGVGMVMSYWNVKDLNTVPLIVAPTIYMIGIIIYSIPAYYEFNRVEQVLKLWIFAGILFLFATGFGIVILFFYEVEVYIGIAIICIVPFAWVIFFLIIKNIRASKNASANQNLPDILKMFSKPKKVTEEEVSVSKEKKICLVCKGKIEGFNLAFICSECATLYCESCARTLSNIENACWVCEKAFDEKKPVRLPKMEEAVDVKGKKRGLKHL